MSSKVDREPGNRNRRDPLCRQISQRGTTADDPAASPGRPAVCPLQWNSNLCAVGRDTKEHQCRFRIDWVMEKTDTLTVKPLQLPLKLSRRIRELSVQRQVEVLSGGLLRFNSTPEISRPASSCRGWSSSDWNEEADRWRDHRLN